LAKFFFEKMGIKATVSMLALTTLGVNIKILARLSFLKYCSHIVE